MTNHNDAIERAEHDIEAAIFGVESPVEFGKRVRPILTDLAAEKYEQGFRVGSRKVIPWMNHVTRYKARLAAVVEELECANESLGLDWDSVECGVVNALNFARGEGGEQTGVAAPLSVPSREPATPDAHGNASRNDETKPQQSPVSDGGLDEIVEGLMLECETLHSPRRLRQLFRAACIRAREADPKLAAVVELQREWSQTAGYHYYARVLGDALARGEGDSDE